LQQQTILTFQFSTNTKRVILISVLKFDRINVDCNISNNISSPITKCHYNYICGCKISL